MWPKYNWVFINRTDLLFWALSPYSQWVCGLHIGISKFTRKKISNDRTRIIVGSIEISSRNQNECMCNVRVCVRKCTKFMCRYLFISSLIPWWHELEKSIQQYYRRAAYKLITTSWLVSANSIFLSVQPRKIFTIISWSFRCMLSFIQGGIRKCEASKDIWSYIIMYRVHLY